MKFKNIAFLIALAAIGFSYDAFADQMEAGVRYTCGKDRVELEAIGADGGGYENPFKVFEEDDAALWNIDRLTRNLPIVKTCTVGAHRLTAVVSKLCAVHQGGIGISASFYSDATVLVDKKGKVVAEDGQHPLVEARQFGDQCWANSDVVFNKISISVGKSPRDLIVEMH